MVTEATDRFNVRYQRCCIAPYLTEVVITPAAGGAWTYGWRTVLTFEGQRCIGESHDLYGGELHFKGEQFTDFLAFLTALPAEVEKRKRQGPIPLEVPE